MPDSRSVQDAAITSDAVIRAVLRRHIQRAFDRREFTRAGLAEESGVNIHTIDTILSRDPGKHRRIAAEDAFCLAYCLGEIAVSALLGTIHYSATRRDGQLSPRQVVAEVLPHLSTIAAAEADGRIDHTEAPACRDAADSIIATVAHLSSANTGGNHHD